MVKKAIDSRIPTLIRNNVQEHKRSFFIIIGDHARDQLPNLHYLLSTVDLKLNKSVLWAYKSKLLGFTSHRKKRETKIKREIKRGTREQNSEDPFELFVGLQNIRYVYYKESEKILGNTFGMCILQDFEGLTPNLLARTIETVEGGGIVVILLKTMTSLKQLYTMTMDVHSRYRTEAHDDVVARFNERFILSLGSCETCLVVDDELNILPISGAKNVHPLPPPEDDKSANLSKEAVKLRELQQSLEEVQPAGSLTQITKTFDQAKAITTFIDALAEKSLRGTVTLTAGRGRGKSAAMGLAVAAAISHGYSNIFITSPSPENLKTLFEFVFKGFDGLGYSEHLDYDILQSTDPEHNKSIIRVNVFRSHRQTIQYIHPHEANVLGQAELVVIDEAAAIPLTLVRSLIGPYLVFMASTINGYEGTGRSLSLKLIQQLREQSRIVPVKKAGSNTGGSYMVVDRSGKQSSGLKASSGFGSRTLREIELNEPIRYAPGDPVERWLNKLLCLDATLSPVITSNETGKKTFPHPNECQLYYVNRDTLFSFHPVSEAFLHRMMALYVASHYKNSPNDLQLLSDAPAHQLYVLLPPTDESDPRLPEPLCVVQLALEGEISKQSIMNNLNRGQRAGGDLIPWIVSQQFQDSEFGTLSGARVIRIASHPEYTKMGYGSRALELLADYFEGKFTPLVDPASGISTNEKYAKVVTDNDLDLNGSVALLTEEIKVRDAKNMPPLLLKLAETQPARLDYLGVSYGMTAQLLKFWKRASYKPVYLRQTPNELTGEHTCVMIRPLSQGDDSNVASDWLDGFVYDFRKRFIQLLAYEFRDFPSATGLSVLESAETKNREIKYITKAEVDSLFSPHDLKRLESYANNLIDYHVVVDLLPTLSQLYMLERLRTVIAEDSDGNKQEELVTMSVVQAAILLGIGLQKKDVSLLEKELNLPSSQVLAMFAKGIRKMSTFFRDVQSRAAEASMFKDRKERRVKEEVVPAEDDEARQMKAAEIEDEEIINGELVSGFTPLTQRLADDLADASNEVLDQLKEKQKALINSLDLTQYAIDTDPAEWDISDRLAGRIAKDGKGVVSVKGKDRKRKGEPKATDIYEEEMRKADKLEKSGKSHKNKKSRKH
ncbi:GNAT acetyltransferase 2-domain-containing protein [Lipomyces oligophaga]|uniref:GNAT acetyltransferase 2-domain-containing protein n=1 Tax=Lipomyces oligophaga TaxID=45792 RepID=UPI0034CD052E